MLIYYVKDGPRPDNSGTGRELSQPGPAGELKLLAPADLQARLAGRNVRYLGENPPEFNRQHPSQYSQHVVIEISSKDSICQTFDRAGFFIIENLNPADASKTIFKGLTIGPTEP